MTTDARPRPAPADPACYVYGIVPTAASDPRAVGGIGTPPAPVVLVRHRQIAALVSEIDPDRPLGTPEDLLGHARVLDTLAAARIPVLPFRFGAVVRDVRAVTDELLDPGEDRFAAGLAELTGLAQFTLRGTYRQDAVLRELLEQRADIAGLRGQIAALPEDAARPQLIELGGLVAEDLAVRGRADTARLLEALEPLAVECSVVTATPDQPVDASFLVPDERRAEFERAAEALAASWAGRLDLRLLGPLAAYDFAARLVDGQGPG